MSGRERAPGYVPNPDYSEEDWNEVSDHPEMTDAELAQLRPAAEVMPEIVEALLRSRGAQKAATKALFSLRVDRDVLEAYRATGPGWQGRMNEALRKSIGLG